MQGLSHLRIVNPAELESAKKQRRSSLSGDLDSDSPRKITPHLKIHGSGTTPKVKVDHGAEAEGLDEKLAELLESINEGQVEKVSQIISDENFDKRILDHGDDVDGYTPLMTAAAYEDDTDKALEMTKIILDKDASVYTTDKKGNTCLHWVSRLGSNNELVEHILKSPSDIARKNLDGNTPLHLASRYGNIECVRIFLKNFVTHVNDEDDGGKDLPGGIEVKEEVEISKVKEETEIAVEPSQEADLQAVTMEIEKSREEEKTENGEEPENSNTVEEENVEDNSNAPKRNPMRGVRMVKSTEEEKKQVKRRGRPPLSKPYIMPRNHKENSIAAHATLMLRNLKGETAFDVAAEKYDPEDSKPKNIEADIKVRRQEIQREFYKASHFFKTLVLHHFDCLGHVPVNEKDKDVWEAPERIQAILSSINEIDEGGILLSSAFGEVDKKTLLMAHSQEYVDFVYKLSEEHVQALDSSQLKNPDLCDTSFSKGSLQAALRASGAVIHAVDRVMKRFQRNAFCIVRPPGHHAGIDGLLEEASSCGFCIFNNVAIGALHALAQYPDKIKKVAILDFDVHHGNGTEEIVSKYNRENGTKRTHIMFFSAHLFDGARPGSKYEFYPGSGEHNNIYSNIINVPMQPLWRRKGLNTRSTKKTTAERFYLDHFGRSEFRRIIKERLIPALRAYEPDLIMLSAGFDAGRRDVGNGRFLGRYCSGFNLQKQDFTWITTQISKVANLSCEGRIVSVLEGGYGRITTPNKTNGGCKLDRSSLARNCCAHLEGLVDPHAQVEPDSSESEDSEMEYDEYAKVCSEEYDDVNSRNSRSRKRPNRFEAEIEKAGRAKKSVSRGMKADIEMDSRVVKPKKRGRPPKISTGDDMTDEIKLAKKEKRKYKAKLLKEKLRQKAEKAKEKPKKLKSKHNKEKEGGDSKKEKSPKQTKAKKRKTLEEEEARQRVQKRQDALEYLQKVKKKFGDNPDVYRSFLGVMGDFKQGVVDVNEVIEKVRTMFKGDRILIEGFNTFLPPGYTIKFSKEDEVIEAKRKEEEEKAKESQIAEETGENKFKVKSEYTNMMETEEQLVSESKEKDLTSYDLDVINQGKQIQSSTENPEETRITEKDQKPHSTGTDEMKPPTQTSHGPISSKHDNPAEERTSNEDSRLINATKIEISSASVIQTSINQDNKQLSSSDVKSLSIEESFENLEKTDNIQADSSENHRSSLIESAKDGKNLDQVEMSPSITANVPDVATLGAVETLEKSPHDGIHIGAEQDRRNAIKDDPVSGPSSTEPPKSNEP